MNIGRYLGSHIDNLLSQEPFNDWELDRSTENDLERPIINYVFSNQGLQLRCDEHDRISAIFLEHGKSKFDIGDRLADLPFSYGRERVLSRFGKPSKSGDEKSHPILGDYGAWDRFFLQSYTIHIEYQINSDFIRRITFMKEDAVPS